MTSDDIIYVEVGCTNLHGTSFNNYQDIWLKVLKYYLVMPAQKHHFIYNSLVSQHIHSTMFTLPEMMKSQRKSLKKSRSYIILYHLHVFSRF